MLRSPGGQTNYIWLVIQFGEGRVGLLAEITHIVSSSGFNIKEYSGSDDDENNQFYMNFTLKGGDPDTVAQMCARIGATQSVVSWAIGCRLPHPYSGDAVP